MLRYVMITALIVGIIVGFGFFGGFVNYLLAAATGNTPPRFGTCVALGIAASALVPLFLNMTSSELLKQLSGKKLEDTSVVVDALILAGFCLVAAISAQAFIQKISTALLNRELRDLRAQVANLKESVEPIVAKETEQEPGAMPQLAVAAAPNIRQMQVLRALLNPRYTLRSLSGICRDSTLPAADVQSELDALVDHGLVARRTGRNGPRWFITEAGRALATV